MLADLKALGAGLPFSSGRVAPRRGVRQAASLRVWVVAAVALLAVATVAVYLYLHKRQVHRLTEKDTIVLADFTNTTGDPVFDGTLRQGLSAQLEQSPFLNLLSDTRIAQTLALMAQPKDTQLTRELARGLPADGQRGHHRRHGCQPRQPVRAGPQGGELPQRRPAG